VQQLDSTIAIGVLACLGSFALVPLVRRVALAYGVTDRPGNGKLHRQVTPYLGGVAMVLVALGASSFVSGWSAQAAVILAGGLMVATVGLVDDIRNVMPGPRLLVEALAALLAVSVGAHVELFNNPLDWLVTVAWLVVITNSFNLLDNMDGAAGVIATTTAIALTMAALLEGQVLVGGMAAVLAGSCLGFLLHNWYPARIFMGDAGSLFLGYVLAVIALKLRFPVPQEGGIAAVLLLAAPAVFDTTLVVIARLRAGRKIYLGGTDHTSHRLLKLGLGTPAVAVIMATGTAITTGLGVAVGRGALPSMVFIGVAAAGGVLLGVLLRVPVYGEGVSRESVRAEPAERLALLD
jgi:UDP-GlcNAc:undecaprenyl-phosphate/decaprenyl-phosphate GlcNAc-1-phosphate transferase